VPQRGRAFPDTLAKLPWNRSSAGDIDADIDAAVARLRG
jgi:hypothetical protein